jgi:predicted dehydrogenase
LKTLLSVEIGCKNNYTNTMTQQYDTHMTNINRRKFLHRAGAGVALFNILPARMLVGAERPGANSRVNLAGIGVGSRGGADVEEISAEGANIVALCDVDDKYAATTFSKFPKATRFKDYRVMLDKMGKEIDGVIIGTPDHTHALITMEAMRRGKHVYCEKPLTHNIYEVRQVMAAAHKHKVVTQLGNQGHSTGTIRQLCEWVWAGAIGNVHTVHAGCDAFPNVYCQMGNLDKLDQHYDVPAGLDYELWIGPVPFRPYTPFWVPWNWRGWMPFGTGTIGDWFCHVIDPSFWALDLNAPSTVQAEVTNYDPAKHGLTYPPGSRITYEFPARKGRGPVKLVWHDGSTKIPRPRDFSADDKVPATGAVLFGDNGMIVHGSHGAGGCYLTPEKLMDQYSGKNAPPQKIPRIKNHAWDFLDAIRSGRPAGSNFDYGGPLTQCALLGAIAIHFPGELLKWDDAKMRITNHEAANAMVHPAYRKGWKI